MAESKEKIDQRISKTNHALASALVELTLEQGYDAVTIRALTERAGVGYATFFRHYPDKDALLDDVMKLFVVNLTARLEQSSHAEELAAEGALIFDFVSQYRELCKVLFMSRTLGELSRAIYQASPQMIDRWEQMRQSRISVPAEIVLHHQLTSTLALIDWWLTNEMPYAVGEMGNIYARLIIEPTRALMLDNQ